jgi:hypothetical protein
MMRQRQVPEFIEEITPQGGRDADFAGVFVLAGIKY